MRRVLAVVGGLAVVAAMPDAIDPGTADARSRKVLRCPTKSEPKRRCPKLSQVIPLKSNGTISLDTARKAFAATVAPLPGVKPPKGGYPHIRSASTLVRAVLQQWAKLTPEQRAAVQKALPAMAVPGGTASAAREVRRGHVGAAGLGAGLPGAVSSSPRARGAVFGLPEFGQIVVEALPRLNERLSPPLTKAIEIELGPAENAGAIAYVGNAGECRIRITPAGQSDDIVYSRELMLHELTHCYQYQRGSQEMVDWLHDGSAEWVAGTLGQIWSGKISSTMKQDWGIWYTNFTAPLMKHKYSALGFWAHLAHTSDTAYVFQTLPTVFAVKTPSKNAYDIVVDPTSAAATQFRRTTASAGTRLKSLGGNWDTSGPGIPSADKARYDPKSIAVGAGSVTVTAVAYGHKVVGLNPAKGAEAVKLKISTKKSAWGLIHHEDGDHDMQDGERSFCTREKEKCECPDGSTLQPLGDDAYLSLYGYKQEAKVKLESQSLEDACESRSTNLKVTGAFNMTITTRGACGHKSTDKPATLSALFQKVRKTPPPPTPVGAINLTAGSFQLGTYDQQEGDEKAGRVNVTKYGEPGGMVWGERVQRRNPPFPPKPYPGSVTIESISSKGRVYGTVHATLGAGLIPDSTVQVSGRWSCDPYDLILPPGTVKP